MLSNREYDLVKKIEKGRGGIILEDGDKLTAGNLRTSNIVKTGYDDSRKVIRETVSLTDSGRNTFYRERRMRTPWRKVLHYFLHPIFGGN